MRRQSEAATALWIASHTVPVLDEVGQNESKAVSRFACHRTPKMAVDPTAAHQSLWNWCRSHDFAGYDPFDALNSRLFQGTPLKHSRVARIAWTQLCKRSPVNPRSLTLVSAGKNPKGIALFALAALSDFRRLRTKESEAEARALLHDLLRARLESKSGATCWGYNFDWQGRAFFAPRGTPTIVPTAFAARALVEAARSFGDDIYLETARSTCDFILQDLNRCDESEETVCFSYSPLDRTCVFNASLLAAETLATVGSMTGDTGLCDWAIRAMRYVVRRQNDDGSWGYGKEGYQSWSDNFHTAFILTSLSRIIQALAESSLENERNRSQGKVTNGPSEEFAGALRCGYDFWRERFFLANGWPRYYPDRLYPADAHSAGAAIIALTDLQSLDPGALDFAGKIAEWTIENLRDTSGYFYYQRRRFYTMRTPYMRWSEAWMLYALSRLLEEQRKKKDEKQR